MPVINQWTFIFSGVNLKVKVAQSCPILYDPMDYTFHGILHGRILEWLAFPFSRGSFQPRDWTQVSSRWILYQLSHKGSPRILEWVTDPFSSISSQPRVELGSPAFQVDSLPTELSGKKTCIIPRPFNKFSINLSSQIPISKYPLFSTSS